MSGSNSITNIDPRKFRNWLGKNYWEYVSTKKHENWEYNLEIDGEYMPNSGHIQMKSLNFNIDPMRECTIKFVLEYMGISKDTFLQYFPKNKKIPDEILIECFKNR